MDTVFDPWWYGLSSYEVASASQCSAQALAELQHRRLRSLLEHARLHSSLYGERLAHLPSTMQGLADMVPVDRHELMQRFDDWVCDAELRLAPLQDFTADSGRIGEPYLGRYLIWESSGTSAAPGIFVQDARCMALYDALEAQRRSPAHIIERLFNPLYMGDRIAFVGATGGHFASLITVERLRRLQPWLASAVQSFSIMQPLGDLVAQLQAFSPTVLTTYPTAALMLAQEVTQGRLRLATVREVWTGGETLGVNMRQEIEKALGAPVRNSYGASEFLAMGWECRDGNMHLNSDWVLLEPVNSHRQPVPAGEMPHSVLLTHLANTVQPLIRYDLGDQVLISPQACTCGCQLPVIEVQGRRDDTLLLDGISGRKVPLLPLALSTVLEESVGLFDFQICQRDASTLVLRLPETGKAGKAAVARARNALKAFALSQGTRPIKVVGELGVRLPRGRSGKACRILPATP